MEWRKWDNRHRYVRQGKGFNTMTEGQRELAFNLLKASLSADGLKQTRDIMKLNGTLAELTQRFEEYGLVVLDHDHGRTQRHQTVGLATRWTSRGDQLLCARRSGSHEPGIHGI